MSRFCRVRYIESELTDAGRDGRTRVARSNSWARMGTGEKIDIYSLLLISPHAGLATTTGSSIPCGKFWPYWNILVYLTYLVLQYGIV